MPSDPAQAAYFALYKLSEDLIIDIDENELLPKREHASLVNRILRELAIELRLKLWTDTLRSLKVENIMREEVTLYTKNIVDNLIQNIVKRAVRNGI
jgi:hypothetical protein